MNRANDVWELAQNTKDLASELIARGHTPVVGITILLTDKDLLAIRTMNDDTDYARLIGVLHMAASFISPERTDKVNLER